MSYAKNALIGSAYAMFAAALGGIIAYATKIFLTSKLTVEEFGLFFAVLNFIVFFLFFRDLGLQAALTKYIAESSVKGKLNRIKTIMASILSIQFLSSALLITAFTLLSGSLAEHYFKDTRAAPLIIIFMILVITSIIFRFIKSALLGFKRFLASSFMEPAQNIAVLGFIALFFALGYGAISAAWGYIAASAIVSLLFFPIFFRTFNPFLHKVEHLKKTTATMIGFGFPLVLASVGGQIIGYMDTIMLTFFTDLASVGVYNVILPSALFILFFANGISTVLVPLVSELYAKNDLIRIAEGMRMLYKYALVITLPAIIAVISYPTFFLSLMFGKDYLIGAFPFQILLIGVLFFMIFQLNRSLMMGVGKTGLITKIVLTAAAANLILNLILIPLLGIVGAALATSLSYMIMLILSMITIKDIVKVQSPVFQWMLTLIPGLAYLLLLTLLVKSLPFALLINIGAAAAIAGAVYIYLCLLLRIIDVKEILRYSRIIMKS